MRRFSFPAVLALVLLVGGIANAQEPGTERQGRQGRKGKALDTNLDGRISRDEWRRNAEVFDKLDANRDGYLTQDEVGRRERKHGRGNERRGHGLRRMDENHDGQIAQGEWKGKAEDFSRLDTNSDGMLTRDEIRGRRR